MATSRAMPTPFYLSIMKLVSFGPSGFLYTYEFNNSLMHAPQKTPFHITVIIKSLNNMHADTFGAGPLSLLERLSLTAKTN